jgi:hypothetical protein
MRILLFKGNKRDEEKQLNDYGRAAERILRFWTFVKKTKKGRCCGNFICS